MDTKYSPLIEKNNEKIKARHMVAGLEAEFEKMLKGKEKAFVGLPATGFNLERHILKRARQENVKLFCYEGVGKVYWGNTETPRVNRLLDQNRDVLSYTMDSLPKNGYVASPNTAGYAKYTNPMFIWRDYCGAANTERIEESTRQCAPHSVVVVTFYAKSIRHNKNVPMEFKHGYYASNLEPYLLERFAEQGWINIWSHRYSTNPYSPMLMMAFTNTLKAHKFLTA
jgi:hypothetical protein